MNHIYRFVWHRILRAGQVACQRARSASAMDNYRDTRGPQTVCIAADAAVVTTRPHGWRWTLAAGSLALVLALCMVQPGWAGGTGGNGGDPFVGSNGGNGSDGSSAQYRGFEQFFVAGSATHTLTGTPVAVTPWTMDANATLSVATDTSLGDTSGDLLLGYGDDTLEVTGTANDTTTRNIGIYQRGFIDIADADNTFTVTGAIGDYDPPGTASPQTSALIKQGPGTLTLAGTNTYTGGTSVEGGTLAIATGSTAGPLADSTKPDSGAISLRPGTTLDNNGNIGSVSVLLGEKRGATTVTNSGSIADSVNGWGVVLVDGSIDNSGSINVSATGFGAGVAVYGEGSVDNSGTISNQQSTAAILGQILPSSSGSIPGSITLTNHTDGLLEGSLGVLANQMVTLAATGNPMSSRPISIINDGGTIRGSRMGIELVGGGTVINRAGATIQTTATASGPCAPLLPGQGGTSGGCAIFAPDVADLTLPAGTVVPPTVLTNAGSIVGDVQLSDTLANDVTLVAGGSINGDFDMGTSVDALLTLKGGAGTTQTWSQAVTGSTTFAGSLTKAGAGTWVLDNAALAGVTGTTISAGTLQIGDGGTSGSIAGDVVDNGTLTFNRSDAVTYTGKLSGNGALRQMGSDELILDGNSAGFAGFTDVVHGRLIVGSVAGNGAQLGGNVTVDAGATLGGHGSIGGNVTNNGTLAPGHSIGTLHIGGDYTAAPDSTYEVEVNAGGEHDLTEITGSVQLDGDVRVLAAQGDYAPQTDYTILTADGGVSGRFDSVSANLAFLDPSLAYDPNNVILMLLRNDSSFASKAKTPNQHTVAAVIDDGGPGEPLYGSVVKLTAPGARQAFDALSGEYYANRQSALIKDSSHLRQAVSQRLNRDCVATQTAATTVTQAQLCAGTVWLRAYGDWGGFDGDGNAADIDFNAAGLFIGADKQLTSQLRLGFVLGAGHGQSDSGEGRHSSGSNDNVQLGLYAGYRNGPVNLKAGVAHSWYSLDSDRYIRYPGFSDHTTADSDANSTQVFVEGGYTFDFEATQVTPFVRGTYVHLHTDGFSEDGGAAAVEADSSSHEIGTTLTGVRIKHELQGTDRSRIRLHGMVGWQHRFGDMTPEATLRFNGNQPFTVSGTPMAQDALAVRAGADASVSDNLTVGLSYVGQYGGGTDSNGVRASLEWAF